MLNNCKVMENNLKHSLNVILNSAMKEKEEFINKVCEMIENKDCDCNSTIDLGSGKRVDKHECKCIMSGECNCGDDCNCQYCSCKDKSHHHKHTAEAIIQGLEKLTNSINQLNETLKHGKK